ncbi:MAG: hypothetical protein ACKOCT_10560 [Alphaproteobacteria bacterium]
MSSPAWCRLVGIDPDVVAQCTATERRRLGLLAKLYLLPAVVCGLACAVIGEVALRSPVAAVLLGAAGSLSTLNVVRLLVASGGMPPDATEAEARLWRPGWNQVLSLGLWVGLQVPILAAWLLVRTGFLRGALDEWRVVQSQLGGAHALAEPGLSDLLVVAAARREAWLATAAVLSLLALLPCLYRRVRSSGFAAYARHLRRRHRSLVEHEWEVHRGAAEEMLAAFRPARESAAPDEWFADPPWRREPKPPHPAAFDRIRTARDLPLPPGRAVD